MTCSIPGCDKPARARGWCWAHYSRWRDHGDPLGSGKVGRPRGTKRPPEPPPPDPFDGPGQVTVMCGVCGQPVARTDPRRPAVWAAMDTHRCERRHR